MELARFSVSLEADLLAAFDRYCSQGQFATRSEAVRQLIHEKLTQQAVAHDSEDVAASLTLVYDHHKSHLTDTMISIQHEHQHMVVSSMHVHLTHELCMELIALRGPAKALHDVAARLSGLKGVQMAHLVPARADTKHNHPRKTHG